jgi:L-2-hydroxyglutarate oxidase LhgO
LEVIAAAAQNNCVSLEWFSAQQAIALEPALHCVAALYSPLTGIIDSHAYMLALLGDAQAHGAVLACRSRVARMWRESAATLIAINDEARPQLRARTVINCASLHAPQVAAMIEGFPTTSIPTPYYARGHYFGLTGRAPFHRLIYPVPEPGGLGVHLTLDLAGRARFGPDVEWVSELNFDVSIDRAERFYGAIRRFWPELREGQLVPAYAGIRPKISGPGQPAADFRIDGPADHGVPGIVNLFGIESPGLTASLALADHVATLV